MSDSAPQFSIALGNGVYMDSNGAIVSSPVPNAPLFQANGYPLPVKPEKIKDIFDGVRKVLPNPDADPNKDKVTQYLAYFGASWATIKLLGKVAMVLGVLATAVTIVGILVDIAIWAGLLLAEDDGMKVFMQKKFQELEDLYKGAIFINEVDKCDVVCANCHRIRTQRQRASFSWSWAQGGDSPRLAAKTEIRLRQVELLTRLRCVPCLDCAGSFPSLVMEFDHRDPQTKRALVSHMAGRASDRRILDEVA